MKISSLSYVPVGILSSSEAGFWIVSISSMMILSLSDELMATSLRKLFSFLFLFPIND